MATLEELLKPVVLVNRKDPTKRLIIGSVAGVNDRLSIKSPFKLFRGEIGALYSYWLSRLASVYACFDAGQSGSTEVRLAPYADYRLGELSEYLDKPFMAEQEEAWLSDNKCQNTAKPLDPVNDTDLIELPVSTYELLQLVHLQQNASDADPERIRQLEAELNTRRQYPKPCQ